MSALGRGSRADQDLEEVIRLAENRPGSSKVLAAAHAFLGTYYRRHGDPRRAGLHYSRAAQLDPDGQSGITREARDYASGAGTGVTWVPSPGLRSEMKRRITLPTTGRFYLLPVYGSAQIGSRDKDLETLEDMRKRLGGDGPEVRVGFSEVFGYMTETIGPQRDYVINLARLRYILALAVELKMPLMIHLNGGNWADYLGDSPYSLHDYLEKDRANVQWYHDNTVDSDDNPLTEQGNEVFLTHSRKAEVVQRYKKRNLQAAHLHPWGVIRGAVLLGW